MDGGRRRSERSKPPRSPHCGPVATSGLQPQNAAGTISGADTDRLLDLLGRTPTSSAYAYRWFVPLDLLYFFWLMMGQSPSWAALVAAYDAAVANGRAICPPLESADPPGGISAIRCDLEIPLVQPDNLTEDEFPRGA